MAKQRSTHGTNLSLTPKVSDYKARSLDFSPPPVSPAHPPRGASNTKGHVDLFHWLLAQGKNDVNDTCANGMNSLFLATDYANADMVKAVLKAGGDHRSQTVDGWTPLHAATRVGNLRMMRALIRAGSDPEARGVSTCTGGAASLFHSSWFFV